MIDTPTVATAITDAAAMHAALREAIGEQHGSQGEHVQASRDPAAPLSIEALDQADVIADQLTGWARVTEEESGEPVTFGPVADVARWLAQRAVWIAGAGWAPDLVEELRTSTRRGEGLLGLLPRRTEIPVPCECGGRQWIVHESVAYVRCEHGHLGPLADYAYGHGVAAYTFTQAARMLGISDRAVAKAVMEGRLAGRSSGPGRPGEVDALALAAYRPRT